MTEWHKEKIFLKEHELEAVDIIRAPLIATGSVGDGRGVPLLILDTTNREDIKDFICSHKNYQQGVVHPRWGRDKNKNIIILHLGFTKPTECNITLKLDIRDSFGIIDWIVHSQMIYIQAGKKGDAKVSIIGEEKTIVEIPSNNFRDEWNNICLEQLSKHFRKTKRISKRKSIELTKKILEEFRITREIDKAFR